MTPAGCFSIAADHPCLPGHFPGRPLVPGVMLLQQVFACLRAAPGGGEAIAVQGVKFIAPVGPGQVVEVSFAPVGADRLAFAGAVDGVTVLSGTARFLAAP